MKAEIRYASTRFSVDLSKPISISLPVHRDYSNPNAYFLPAAEFDPFCVPGFTGSVAQGGPCNCEILRLAPHGNGTHTECVGHIAREATYIIDSLRDFHSVARVCTIHAQELDGDLILRVDDVSKALEGFEGQSLVLRTDIPNQEKISRQWSGTNPPYCEKGMGTLLREYGILHFLLDVPSVDRESDGGALQVHHEFWNYPYAPRLNATITEMILVPDFVADGDYFLHIGIPPLQTDAVPSTCSLYALQLVEHDGANQSSGAADLEAGKTKNDVSESKS